MSKGNVKKSVKKYGNVKRSMKEHVKRGKLPFNLS